jgi:D-3-phosphoglycerate dehydrogenase
MCASRIIVTDATFPGFEAEKAVAARHEASFEEAHCLTADDVLQAASRANVLMVQFAQITAAAIERLPPKGAIVRYGLGLDNIDLKAAEHKGIRVAYVPDYATGEVADHTAALIVAALRKLLQLDASVRANQWDPLGIARPLRGLAQTVVGFVGFGRIGREVHARLKPFGFKSAVADPYADAATIRLSGAEPMDLETLFSMVDVVTLHAPLTPATRHLVNAQRLARMKPTALIVNTARGALVDTTALEAALTERRIGGAALDVFETEPLPANSKLRHLPNVLLTPHVAWYSTESARRVQELAADEVDRYLSGRPARCPAQIT